MCSTLLTVQKRRDKKERYDQSPCYSGTCLACFDGLSHGCDDCARCRPAREPSSRAEGADDLAASTFMGGNGKDVAADSTTIINLLKSGVTTERPNPRGSLPADITYQHDIVLPLTASDRERFAVKRVSEIEKLISSAEVCDFLRRAAVQGLSDEDCRTGAFSSVNNIPAVGRPLHPAL